MDANIWFDVAALWLLAIQWYILFLRRHVGGGRISRFKLCLSLITIAAVCDTFNTFSDIMIYKGKYSILTNTAVMMSATTLYYLAHSLTMVAFVMYLSSLFKLDENGEIVRLIYGVPASIIFTAIGLNLLTGQVFYYANGRYYRRGPFVLLIYSVAVVYLLYALYVLLRYAKQVTREKRWTLFSMIIFIFSSNIIQFFNPIMRVENFAVSVVAVMIYLFIESPSNYIDSQTGLFGEDSFFVHFNSSLRNHAEMRLLFVSLDDVDEWDRGGDHRRSNRQCRRISSRDCGCQ